MSETLSQGNVSGLNRCPKCRSKELSARLVESARTLHQIYCRACGHTGPLVGSAELARYRWNRQPREKREKVKVQRPAAPKTVEVCEEVELTQADCTRAEKLVRIAADRALLKAFASRFGWSHFDNATAKFAIAAFQTTLRAHCSKLIAAARVKPGQLESINEGKRRKLRQQLADELRGSRRALRQLKAHIANAEKNAKEKLAWCTAVSAATTNGDLGSAGYPPIPMPCYSPSEDGDGLPEEPGIYFFWNGGIVEYVGQSICLKQRVRVKLHHKLHPDHRISVLLFPRYELTWAECYYIGVAKPRLNFGVSASHVKYAKGEIQEGGGFGENKLSQDFPQRGGGALDESASNLLS